MKKILIILLALTVGIFFMACPPKVEKPVAPTFDPAPGGVASGTEITMTTTTEGAIIYYTLDGTDPSESSSLYDDANKPKVVGAFQDSVTVKAIAWDIETEASSDITSGTYTINPKEFTLTLTINGDGTVVITDDGTALTGTGPWTIEEDSELVFTATPTGSNGSFVGWSGDINSTDNPYTVNSVTKNYAVTATFFDPAIDALVIVHIPTNIWGDASGYEFLMDTDGDMVTDTNELVIGSTWTDTNIQSLYNTYNDYLPVPAVFPPSSGADFAITQFPITANTYDIAVMNPSNATGWDGTNFVNPPTAGPSSANPTYLAGTGAINNVTLVAGETYVVYITGNQTDGETIILLDEIDPTIQVTKGSLDINNDSINIQDLGTVGGLLTIKVKNLGWNPLTISDISFTDLADLTMEAVTTPTELGIGGSLNLQFNATENIPDSGIVSITSNDPANGTFEFKFSVSLPDPITSPESFEGVDFDNLTSGNQLIIEGDTLPTLSSTYAFDGSQSLRFTQAADGNQHFGKVSFFADVTNGDSMSFYYRRVSGSTVAGFSTVTIYADGDVIGTVIQGGTDTEFKKWISPIFTETGKKFITIEFLQQSSGTNMDVYVDYLNVAPPTASMEVTFNDNAVPSDGTTYSLPTIVGANTPIIFKVKAPLTTLVPLELTAYVYDNAGTGATEITNTTPLVTPITLNAGEETQFEFTITTTGGPFTSGLIEITNNSDYSTWSFMFSGLAVTPPDPPTDVTVVAGASTGNIDVSWTAPATPPTDGYNVYRSETSGGPYTKVNSTLVSAATTIYEDFALTGLTYYYVITSANDVTGDLIESVYSAESTGYVSDTPLFYELFTDLSTWTVTNDSGITSPWAEWTVVPDRSGSTLDGTSFAIADSDEAGSGMNVITTMTSPVIDASLASSLNIRFDQYYRHLGTAAFGKVEVYNGTDWVTVLNQTASAGSWTAISTPIIDVTAHANANFQVRFVYNDGNSWAWYWAVDNLYVY
jgi:hypothetical protein